MKITVSRAFGGVISWFCVSQLPTLVIIAHWIYVIYLYCFSFDLSLSGFYHISWFFFQATIVYLESLTEYVLGSIMDSFWFSGTQNYCKEQNSDFTNDALQEMHIEFQTTTFWKTPEKTWNFQIIPA